MNTRSILPDRPSFNLFPPNRDGLHPKWKTLGCALIIIASIGVLALCGAQLGYEAGWWQVTSFNSLSGGTRLTLLISSGIGGSFCLTLGIQGMKECRPKRNTPELKPKNPTNRSTKGIPPIRPLSNTLQSGSASLPEPINHSWKGDSKIPDLADDAIQHILSFLNPQSMVQFSQTCHKAYTLSRHAYLHLLQPEDSIYGRQWLEYTGYHPELAYRPQDLIKALDQPDPFDASKIVKTTHKCLYIPQKVGTWTIFSGETLFEMSRTFEYSFTTGSNTQTMSLANRAHTKGYWILIRTEPLESIEQQFHYELPNLFELITYMILNHQHPRLLEAKWTKCLITTEGRNRTVMVKSETLHRQPTIFISTNDCTTTPFSDSQCFLIRRWNP